MFGIYRMAAGIDVASVRHHAIAEDSHMVARTTAASVSYGSPQRQTVCCSGSIQIIDGYCK